jgi:uncharacterized surface anchored protein
MKKTLLVLMFTIIFILIQFFPAFLIVANAAEKRTEIIWTDFISDISITDINGDALPAVDVPKDYNIRLAYSFAVPGGAPGTVGVAGDTFTVNVPSEILITGPASTDIMLNPTDLLATAVLDDVAHTITLTFTQDAFDYSNVTGNFWFELSFDEGNIGLEEPVEIDFDTGGTSPDKTIEIDFDQPPPPEATIEKSGSYNSATKEIEWTITANAEGATINSMQVVDTLSLEHDFVAGSVIINNNPADPLDYEYTPGTRLFEYNFTGVITTAQEIKFRTLVSNAALLAETSDTLTITNSADLIADGYTIPSEDVTEDIPITLINKTRSYDSDNKKIDWEITVNQSELEIDNATVTDTLQAGLTLDGSSVVYDSTSISLGTGPNTYQQSGQDLTFNLGDITGEHTIYFSTFVDSSIYLTQTNESFSNTATLNGDDIVANNVDSANITPNTRLMEKNSSGYTASTGRISWEIIVNPYKESLENVVITDNMSVDQEYVDLTFTIKDSGGVDYLGGSLVSSVSSIVYTFPATPPNAAITDTYTITFETLITDPEIYENNYNQNHSNTASIALSNGTGGNENANQRVTSNVLEKTVGDYEYDTREIEWTIIVNNNQMSLTDVLITDTIEANQTFIESTFSVVDNLGAVHDVSNLNLAYDNVDTFTYSFPGEITQKYTITYKTELTDLSLLRENQTITLENTAYLDHDDIAGPLAVNYLAQKDIISEIIYKEETYSGGTDYIDWEIIINRNEVEVIDAVITDTFQNGLMLDTSTLELYNMTVADDREVSISGAAIPIDEADLAYDLETRTFGFTMPTPINTAYSLRFRTYVTIKNISYTNNAQLDGEAMDEDDESEGFEVTYSGAGGSATGNLGSMTVNKVDAENNLVVLEGGVFVLVDQYDLIIDRVGTDENGEAFFDRLRFGVPYTVKEETPPEGYNPSLPGEDEYSFTIEVGDPEYNISYTFENVIIKGDIQFTKYDENNILMPGAEFTIYDSLNNPVTTSTSSGSGVVLFADIPYGVYTIKETDAPISYALSQVVLDASIVDEGVTVDAQPNTLANALKAGDIRVLKFDEGSNPLQDATFTLYDSGDNPISSETTNSSGIALFTDITYGDYYVVETDAPTGYVLSSTRYDVSITTDGQTVEVQAGGIINDPIMGSISFSKQNPGGDGLEGAVFELMSGGVGTGITAQSDSNGDVVFDDVVYGTYTIEEVTPPEGYLLNDTDSLSATIVTDGQAVVASPDTMVNQHIVGSISLTKNDESGGPLLGAEYTIYDESSSPVATATSDINGEVLFTDIIYGNYTIRETTPPEGYVLSSTEFSASIVSHGVVVDANPSVDSNRLITGDIQLIKYDETGVNGLEGATFTLYDSGNNIVAEEASDVDGFVLFSDITYGEYTIEETDVPIGYVISSTVFTAVIGDGDDGRVVSANPSSDTNRLITGNIQLIKYDNYGEHLQGAEFTLYDSGGIEVMTALSDADGFVLFSGVTYGDYTITETGAPTGYLPSLDTFTASITVDGELVTANPSSASNKQIVGAIEFTKMGEESDYLSGAEFTLYRLSDTAFSSPLVTVASDESGVVLFENIIYGDYIIKETKASEGYNLSSQTLSALVRIDGVIVSTTPSSIDNSIIRGTIKASVLDSGGKPLKNVEVGLYDDEGKLVETKTTDGNGVVTFSNVPYGDYTIKNLSGPKGYNSSSDTLSVSVSEETEYSAGSFVNVKIVVAATVRTGDNITYYIIALVVALLVLGFVIVLIFASKRRKKTKTKWRK